MPRKVFLYTLWFCITLFRCLLHTSNISDHFSYGSSFYLIPCRIRTSNTLDTKVWFLYHFFHCLFYTTNILAVLQSPHFKHIGRLQTMAFDPFCPLVYPIEPVQIKNDRPGVIVPTIELSPPPSLTVPVPHSTRCL